MLKDVGHVLYPLVITDRKAASQTLGEAARKMPRRPPPMSGGKPRVRPIRGRLLVSHIVDLIANTRVRGLLQKAEFLRLSLLSYTCPLSYLYRELLADPLAVHSSSARHCSLQTTGSGFISRGSPRSAGCRPSRIASTTSGASSVSRRIRPT